MKTPLAFEPIYGEGHTIQFTSPLGLEGGYH